MRALGSSGRMTVSILIHAAIACAFTLFVALQQARATMLSTAGFDFSDELGGFELIAVSGTGTEADPITVVERVNGTGAAVLVIRIQKDARADDGRHIIDEPIVLAFTKIVTNGSKERWNAYGLELQQEVGKPSGYLDGLSFDQLHQLPERRVASDVFAENLLRLEPYDGIRFHSGVLEPGATARFQFTVTDVTPIEEFYLVQQPEQMTADAGPSRPVRLAALKSALRR